MDNGLTIIIPFIRLGIYFTIEMKKEGFADVLERSPLPVLVDFHAGWCGPCKMQDPILREVAQDMPGKVRILKVDVDQNPNVARRFHVQAIPTLILFWHGEPVWRHAGVAQRIELESIIENYN